ncbi:MAG TPA: OB-fold domain-containing protein [Nocardioides sp.]|nr:OB-fold domain-containing protein [Nocardioides sp.]
MSVIPEVPPADEATEAWWAATRQRRLVLQTCTGCGSHQHPPRALCTGCGRTDTLHHREVSGDGTVDACTVVERAMPGFDPPYVVARVRLAEGVVLLSNVLAADPYAVRVGDPLTLDWRALDDGRALPVFTPVPDPALEETP